MQTPAHPLLLLVVGFAVFYTSCYWIERAIALRPRSIFGYLAKICYLVGSIGLIILAALLGQPAIEDAIAVFLSPRN